MAAIDAERPGTAPRIGFRPWDYLVYLAFRLLEFIILIGPLPFWSLLGQTGGLIAWAILPGYRRLAKANLRIAFSESLSERDLRALTRRHFQCLGRNLISSVKLSLMRPTAVEKLVDVEGIEHLRTAFASGRGVIYAIPHMGAWETLTQMAIMGQGKPRAAIYQRLANPYIDALVLHRRSQAGTTHFDRGDGFTGPMKHVRGGGSLGILVDQHAGDHGLWCPFFRRLASTTNLPALIALRAGAPIVPIAIYSSPAGRFRIVCQEPLQVPEKRGNPELVSNVMTALLNESVEALIRFQPEDWFWVHDRWKTPQPNLLLSHYRRGVFLLRPASELRLQPFRVLVRTPNPLGDACMALPTIRAIKKGRPDLHLTILCREAQVPLWNRVSEVDDVVGIPAKASPAEVARLLRLRADFAAAVLLPNSLRTALEAWHTGIPRIIGFRGHTRSWLLTDTVPERTVQGPPPHHAHRYLAIARHLGAETDDTGLFHIPRLPPPPSAPAPLRVGICPGAEYGPAKRWPVDRFAAAARQFAKRTPASFVLFGTKAEISVGIGLEKAMDGLQCENLIGRTSMTELIEALRVCHVLLTNDTGTMHLAAMLGLPTVSIFGSTEPLLTRPLGPNHAILRHHVECSPCFLRECPLDFRCMLSVAPQEAVTALLRITERG